MLSLYLLLFFVYVLCGLIGALMLRNKGPWALLLWSVVFILYSTLPLIGMIMDGNALNNQVFEIIGRSLLVFFSIVGGALFSTAWRELRELSRN